MAEEKIYYCIGCGRKHNKSNFYISNQKIHANGVLPYCKDYIKKYSYNKDKTINLDDFQFMLMQNNLPFLNDIYESSINSKGDIIGNYFRQINSLPQYSGYTWKDSIFGEKEVYRQSGLDEDFKEDDFSIDDFKITSEMLSRWGDSYSKIEIRDLEKFYRDMHMTHTIVTPQHEKALILICKLQLKMDKALEADDMGGFSKMHGEYQKLLTSSGLRPIDKIGGAEASGMRSFSQIFEEIEKDGFIKPAPIKENQDIVDKTIQYIMNYTKKLLNKQILTEPPMDTPKVDDKDDFDD